MADNFFRPGFTQGAWANGEPAKGLNYLVFVGNGFNTLNISAATIDTNLLVSGSVWWEPLGPYGEPGKARNMYDDYFSSKQTRIRIGTSLTRSREDRFSKWYFLPTERLWLNAELIRVNGAPYSGAFTPYTAGLNGWTPMIQTVLAF
jgi:hypothetical protein